MAEESGAGMKKEAGIVYVNGKRVTLPEGLANTTLLEFLRETHRLTGTKLGCGEGGCGACTVMVSTTERGGNGLEHRAVNACLAPVYSVEGCHVVTVEGIGNAREGLHPVQAQLGERRREEEKKGEEEEGGEETYFSFVAAAHGQQCGFCTPGFVMSMYALLRGAGADTKPTMHDVEEAIQGNLCRCTGYRPILDAFRTFTKVEDAAYRADTAKSIGVKERSNGHDCVDSDSCKESERAVCPSSGLPCDCGKAGAGSSNSSAHAPPDNDNVYKNGHGKGRGEVIFPPELLRRPLASLSMGPGAEGRTAWHRPATLAELLQLRAMLPNARLVVGSTEITIEQRMRGMSSEALISATLVPELNSTTVENSCMHIGASVTLTSLKEFLSRVELDSLSEGRVCHALKRQLHWFAGVQIRNVASIGGNICTASPISDLNPLWVAAGADFVVASQGRGRRKIPASDFFVGYRKTALDSDEVLVKVIVPLTKDLEYFHEFKQAHRREDDIAIVNAGMRARFEVAADGKVRCSDVSLCYGGVGPIPVRAVHAETILRGAEWGSADTFETAISALMSDISLNDRSPGGMSEYRMSLAASFLFKFYAYAGVEMQREHPSFTSGLSAKDLAVNCTPILPGAAGGAQVYDAAAEEVAAASASGAPIKHRASDQQVSGEAMYADDVALPASSLHAAFVCSTKAHARIVNIDASRALAAPGVSGFYTARDVPGKNQIGPIVKDEEVFASEIVTCVGQPIGIIVANSHERARECARMVIVTYEDLSPIIMTVHEAIERESYHVGHKFLSRGNPEEVIEQYRSKGQVIDGEIAIGGQEHFYLEPNVVFVVPGENSEVTMISSTQAPAKHQWTVASVLGIAQHKVVCKTKRIGGGFGGKETRSIFINAAVAVAAWHLRVPVKLCLDRDDDMAMTGHRHPFLGRYSVAHAENGGIVAAAIELYSNGGNSHDLSEPVLDRALFHSDNCYRIPHFHAGGRVCRTNTPSNTAFRGFGGPQGMMVMEAIIDDVARKCKRLPEDVRSMHLYQEGDMAHCRQRLDSWKVPECWQSCLEAGGGIECRRKRVDDFNAANRWLKRGIAAVPTKFGISFTATFMNQAGALIHIYIDGTVLVTHGGVEMGQGLHTKVTQIVATELGIPVKDVHISETSTDKVPNASPSAASACTDLYGAASQDACRQLRERLAPYLSASGGDFKQAVSSAYFDRIDLSAHGFYKTPDICWDWETKKGMPFNYFTYGAAVSEVEVDVLTGDTRVLRSDVVMDVGRPVNPAIDVGQIEGGFVQGLGWCMIEELKWGDNAHPWARPGCLLTRGPGAYKIPTADDIPREFNVTLLRDSVNPRAVHSSKAIGEPPFFLASSVFYATKGAIQAARSEEGIEGHFILDSPATPERVRLSCGDKIVSKFADPGVRAKLSV